tara:strand:+ start:637 stop:798 length:162 start_codon:yes stop_codon:yes gene_type:complete
MNLEKAITEVKNIDGLSFQQYDKILDIIFEVAKYQYNKGVDKSINTLIKNKIK